MASLVAVTGADGFIGSHLVEALVERGLRVKALALYNSFGTYGWLDSLPDEVVSKIQICPGDVRDRRSVLDLLDSVTTVYHLAALIAVPYSYHAPQSYVDTNIAGTLNVLEAARDHGTPRVVHASTSEAYGTARRAPIDEHQPLQAHSPYAATKIAADKLVESYHHSFDLPVVTLRPFNTYGPRQSTRAVIPTIITQLARGQAQIALGALTPSRDFLFVADTIGAFLALGEAPEGDVVGEVFNAGTGTEVTIGELARTIADIMGVRLDVSCDEDRKRPEASEVERLVCDARKLSQRTGWQPRYALEAGLKVVIDWYSDPSNLATFVPDRHI